MTCYKLRSRNSSIILKLIHICRHELHDLKLSFLLMKNSFCIESDEEIMYFIDTWCQVNLHVFLWVFSIVNFDLVILWSEKHMWSFPMKQWLKTNMKKRRFLLLLLGYCPQLKGCCGRVASENDDINMFEIILHPWLVLSLKSKFEGKCCSVLSLYQGENLLHDCTK